MNVEKKKGEKGEDGKEPGESWDRTDLYLYHSEHTDPVRWSKDRPTLTEGQAKKTAPFCRARANLRMSVSSTVQQSLPSRPSIHLHSPLAMPPDLSSTLQSCRKAWLLLRMHQMHSLCRRQSAHQIAAVGCCRQR